MTENARIRSVYIAAPYAARDALQPFADSLTQAGVISTARWLTEKHVMDSTVVGAAPCLTDEQVKFHCDVDLYDVDAADAVFMFTGDYAIGNGLMDPAAPPGSGGRHWETGYAHAKGKRIVVIGEPEHIFHRGNCTVVTSWDEALATLN